MMMQYMFLIIYLINLHLPASRIISKYARSNPSWSAYLLSLLSQVGPKQREFSVKDKTAFDFKPQELVSNICAIYLHLQVCYVEIFFSISSFIYVNFIWL